MALIDTDRQLAGAIFTHRIVRAAQDLVAGVIAWNDARVTAKSLSKLTARELDDIGLCRGDIDLIAQSGGRRL